MPTTLKQIAWFLDNKGWKYRIEAEAKRPMIITGVKADNSEDLIICIIIREQGEFIQLVAPTLLPDVKNSPYKGELFEAMLSISWDTKMLQWEYDKSDGEVRAVIEFPIEDSVLTEKQFNRCLDGLIQLVDKTSLPRLKTILSTGKDPGITKATGVQSLGDQLLSALAENPEILAAIEQALARKAIDQAFSD